MSQQQQQPHYLAIDIETCGPAHAVFAIGCVLFKIEAKQMSIVEEKLFSFAPVVPATERLGDFEERTNYGDFDMNTWDKFWLKHRDTLEYIAQISEYTNEKEVIDGFYLWWLKTTKAHHNLRIVSDNPAFDVGYLNSRIQTLHQGKPLAYQWRGKNWYYVSPIDQWSIEWVISQGENSKQCLDTIYQMSPVEYDHNPVNDAKSIGWKYVQLMNYFNA